MCQANKMAEKLYERWGEAALPSIEITHGSGGPTINCFSFIEGTEKQNDALDKELESIQKELRNNERGI